MSYFSFVRWMFAVNIVMAVIVFSFLIVPSLLFPASDDWYREANCTFNDSFVASVECCTKAYRNNLTIIEENQDSWIDVVQNFIQGTGWLEVTELFYGVYEDKSIVFFDIVYYSLPLAYIAVTIFIFLLCFTWLVQREAQGFRQSLLSKKGENHCCNIVFTGWDFCICDEGVRDIKQKQIRNELLTLLDSVRRREERANMTKQDKMCIFLIRILVNLLVIVLLSLCGATIYFVTKYSISVDVTSEDSVKKEGTFVSQYLPSFTIAILNVILPPLLEVLVTYEQYSPYQAVRYTLFRTVILRMAYVWVLTYSVYVKAQCPPDPGKCRSHSCETPMCWETMLGQQLYRLTLMDFFVVIGVDLILQPCRRLFHKITKSCDNRFFKLISTVEFQLPQNTLDLVYSQTICWVGLFYSPILPAIVAIKFFIFFYVKYIMLKYICIPGTVLFRASRSKSFFATTLIYAFMGSVIPVMLFIGQVKPSYACGVFREFDSAWQIVPDTLETFPNSIQNVLYFVTTSAFVVPLMIILLLAMYYYWALASAHIAMTKALRDQLVLEGKDKQYLIARLNYLKKGNQSTAEKSTTR